MNNDDFKELEKTIKSALTKEKGHLKPVPFYKPVNKQYLTLKKRETKDGKEIVLQTIENCCTVLRMDENLAGKIKYNMISYSPFVLGDLPWTNGDNYREWTNSDDSNLKCYIEDTYGLNSMEKIMEALNIVTSENQFNPVVDYLEQLKWDGKERIKNLLPDYLGVEQNEYSAKVMELFMLGAINRAYHPGCKFDYMPVLVGEQGVGKSTFFKILAGNDAWYNDNFNTVEGDKAAEKLRGMWIVELAELLATKKAKEVESIKAFLTSTIDSYRAPYNRRTEQRPRMCVFAGTTNNNHFMTDRTGNRRYLPLIVRKSHVKKSLFENGEKVQEEFKQAWAEALHIFKEKNPVLVFPKHLEDLVKDNQSQFEEEDVRIGIIQDHLDEYPETEDRVCVMQIWNKFLGNEGRPCDKRMSNEIHSIMQHSITGWQRLQNANGGRAKIRGFGTQICYERIEKKVTNKNEFAKVTESEIEEIENLFT
jgi:predicted P-loop ATPase